MSKKQMMKNKKRRVEINNIIYLINDTENIAEIINCKTNSEQIIIPRTIKHESKEYDVIRISENAFTNTEVPIIQFASDSKLQKIDKHAFTSSTIESIKIPSTVTSIGECAFSSCNRLQQIEIAYDSKLHTIERNTFSCSKIESITIPSELIELKEGWCNFTSKATKINVSPKNPKYRCYDDKLIIGKTNINQKNYDCLVFCVRYVRNIRIPSFIEHICSHSFNTCKQLQKIEFSNDSKLKTIDNYAFYLSSINRITIPSSVTSIGEGVFIRCKKLQRIEIPNNSKLKEIDAYAFHFSKIKSISIPSSVSMIGENAFNNCKKLMIIEISNIKLISIYKNAFENCHNALLMIPVQSRYIN